jgi:hypothetical protein
MSVTGRRAGRAARRRRCRAWRRQSFGVRARAGVPGCRGRHRLPYCGSSGGRWMRRDGTVGVPAILAARARSRRARRQLGKIVSRKPDAALGKVRPEFLAHRAAEPAWSAFRRPGPRRSPESRDRFRSARFSGPRTRSRPRRPPPRAVGRAAENSST